MAATVVPHDEEHGAGEILTEVLRSPGSGQLRVTCARDRPSVDLRADRICGPELKSPVSDRVAESSCGAWGVRLLNDTEAHPVLSHVLVQRNVRPNADALDPRRGQRQAAGR